jgi:hypothetical protein
MKTAISIPDSIFREAEKVAKARRVSRSELYVLALTRLLREEPKLALTEAYNDAFDDSPHTEDPLLQSARKALLDIEWDDS